MIDPLKSSYLIFLQLNQEKETPIFLSKKTFAANSIIEYAKCKPEYKYLYNKLGGLDLYGSQFQCHRSCHCKLTYSLNTPKPSRKNDEE